MLPRHYLLPVIALSLGIVGCSGGTDEAPTKPAASRLKGGKPHVNPWAKDQPTPAPAPRPAPKPSPNPWAKNQPAPPPPAARPAPKPSPNPWAKDQPGAPKDQSPKG